MRATYSPKNKKDHTMNNTLLSQHIRKIGDHFYEMLSDIVADVILNDYKQGCGYDEPEYNFVPDDTDFEWRLRVPNHDHIALYAMDMIGLSDFGQDPDDPMSSVNGFAPYDTNTISDRMQNTAKNTLREAANGHHPISTNKTPALWPTVWLNEKEQLSTAFVSPHYKPFTHWPDAELIIYTLDSLQTEPSFIPGTIDFYNTF